MATYAPRILNAPIGWSDSASFRKWRRSTGPNGTSGVRRATPVSVRAAARMSSSETSRSVAGTVIGRRPRAYGR